MNTATRKYSNLIGGEWTGAHSGKVFQTQNPADTRETVAEYPLSNADDARAAIQAAQGAFDAWSAMTPVARGRILSKTAQVIDSRKAELAELLTAKARPRREPGRSPACHRHFRFFGGISYTLGGQTIPHDLPGNLLYTVRQPLGVVALITPWNFPIAIPCLENGARARLRKHRRHQAGIACSGHG